MFRHMTEEPRVSLVLGEAGWAEATWPPNHIAHVHFALNEDKKTVRVDEVALKNPTSDALRSFPLARIEAAADAGGFMLGFAMTYTNPKPPDLDKHFQKIKRQASSNKSAGRFVLERPEGRFLDNGFYIRVAKAYREAVALGLNPRQTLAKDSHSATDTVARWVGEARRRGYLPPGRPGKVTAHFEEGGPDAS